MGRREFGQLVRHYRTRRGRSQGWLAASISHPPNGAIWSGNNIGRLENGQRKVDRDLADELIMILGMDPDEAYFALGWWPPGLTLKDLAAFRARRKADLEWKATGQPERRRYERRRPNGAPDLGPGLSEVS